MTCLVTDHNLVPGPVWMPLTSQVVILCILWNRDESAPILLLTGFLGSHSWATCISLDLPGSRRLDQEGITYGTDLPGATLVRKRVGVLGLAGGNQALMQVNKRRKVE